MNSIIYENKQVKTARDRRLETFKKASRKYYEKNKQKIIERIKRNYLAKKTIVVGDMPKY
jgi:hypothetical protein